MRTASRLQQAEEALMNSLNPLPHAPRQVHEPELTVGMIPVFFEDFLVDIRSRPVHEAVGNFSRGVKLRELQQFAMRRFSKI
jgi:hypothetical protein